MDRNIETNILRELEPVVVSELERHTATAEEWHPHDFVPWSDGENFAYLGGRDWEPEQSKLGEAAKAAMYVNLLTEDNLPSYHREIATVFGRDSAWGEWVGQWTAEEAKHGISMRDYLVVTRAVDPVKLEHARMKHMRHGYDSGDKTPLEAIAYVTMQELATRIAHRNTGLESKRDGDVLADRLLARIAKDENLHMVFYRNLGKAALEVAPAAMMQAIVKEIDGFQMPGAESIPGFGRNALAIADAGIYDLQIHQDKVVAPVLREWDIWNRTDLGAEGAAARDALAKIIEKKHHEAALFAEWRASVKAQSTE